MRFLFASLGLGLGWEPRMLIILVIMMNHLKIVRLDASF